MKTNTMKILRLLLLLLFIPVTFHGQKTLTGVWTGKMTNDSTTARKDQGFEIALTQYKNKVYGYSRNTFIVNDTLYYILKRVKGTIDGDVCEITDDDIISYNFPGKIDKGIKVTTTFRMNHQDSTWHLTGDFKTNQSRRRGFYSVGGKIEMKDEPNIEKSAIIGHLEELKMANNVPFYAEAKKQEAEKQKQAEKTLATTASVNNKNQTETKPEPKRTEPVVAINKSVEEKKKSAETIVNNPQPKKDEPIAVHKKTQPATTVAAIPPEKKPTETIINNPEPRRTEPMVAIIKPVEEKKKPAETIVNNPQPKIPMAIGNEPIAVMKPNQPATTAAAVPAEKKPTETVIAETRKTVPATITTQPVINAPFAAVMVKERKTAPPQEVNFRSDSLELALYDNGEVDGDSVSVLMNGEIILAKQGLKTSAIKKTIYIQPGTNEVMLVLYAENLGKYPPNTGLLVVYDGDDRYQVRFSADLQQNASVIFRRKK
jgi:hypothetical protein